jgi:hypothetical protein
VGESGHRRALNAEYEKVQQEIGDLFAQRKDAVDLGVADVVDARLEDLKKKRDEIQSKLNRVHDKGTAWIEKVIRAFELVKLLREAILFGPRQTREMALGAITSNLSVDRKKLILKLRPPFRESAQTQERPEWWSGLYDVRTEISETCDHLEAAVFLLQQAIPARFILQDRRGKDRGIPACCTDRTAR